MRGKTILVATLAAGSLDLASAIVLTLVAGKPVVRMLQRVASGPLGEWPLANGEAGAAAGVAVHYALMTVMAAVFVLVAARLPRLRERQLLYGAGYGVLLYLIMYWIVVPLRWPSAGAASGGVTGILIPLAVHICLVGVPFAVVAARARRAT
ncbi:hypothetical protein MZO42_16980 [Sphingomonas psychrotolerans]|uniref:DUF1440 domain-containing protein n=1 Tax=Sphingomonas psychrotolerans TaxID=1327635 RepID=A0ABU3N7E7_9SPHN|nr:hypothetical protein [Sphingomonas psychrotolerans]MDT8760398.1 hypothetical protein [Sphingomonas psychrotolerans]